MAALESDERRTALLVEVPVEAPVDDFRGRHLAGSVARGIPAHVTVTFPFAAASSLDPRLHADVVEHFASFDPFTAALTRVDRFDAHVWLAPAPHERFVELLTRTYDRFPQFPPYGDAFAEPVPHLTIAEIGQGESIETVAADAERELGVGLPFAFAVDRVSLYEERPGGTWQRSDSFELG